MKARSLAVFVTGIMSASVALGSTGLDQSNHDVSVIKNLASMPLTFTKNEGQWDEKVLFRSNAGGATVWFTSDGVYHQFTRRVPGAIEEQTDPLDPIRDELYNRSDSMETISIKAAFVGANPSPRIIGQGLMEYKCNYFIGNDPNNWHTDVPNYQAVAYEDIYPGIDLKYYGNGTQMEYDSLVSPGADFSQITIQCEGAESLEVNGAGELVVTTKWGEVIEQRPVIYQIENGMRTPVEGTYSLQGDNSFGFELSNCLKTYMRKRQTTLTQSNAPMK